MGLVLTLTIVCVPQGFRALNVNGYSALEIGATHRKFVPIEEVVSLQICANVRSNTQDCNVSLTLVLEC